MGCFCTDSAGQGVTHLRPRQNGRHFPDIFKCIFLNENVWISIKISLKFVPNDPIINFPTLVQIMTWHQATSHYLNQCWLIYWSIYAPLCLNELNSGMFIISLPLTLRMLEMEYSCSLSCQGISRHGIHSIGKATYGVAPLHCENPKDMFYNFQNNSTS